MFCVYLTVCYVPSYFRGRDPVADHWKFWEISVDLELVRGACNVDVVTLKKTIRHLFQEA